MTGTRPGGASAGAARAGGGQRVPGTAGADSRWLAEAIGLSRRCPPSATAFSVGAILVAGDGGVIATGFSRERDPHDHAEEVALAKATSDSSATLYSSLEPCAARASRPRSCAELVIAAGLRRVVIAWLEPPVFVDGGGAGRLRAAGVTVIEIPELAPAARAVYGSSATNVTLCGALKCASRPRVKAISSASVALVSSRSTTNACGASPHFSCGSPTIAASRDPCRRRVRRAKSSGVRGASMGASSGFPAWLRMRAAAAGGHAWHRTLTRPGHDRR